mgnify:FL=1|jgi:ligand-binding sensor domain-containing protein
MRSKNFFLIFSIFFLFLSEFYAFSVSTQNLPLGTWTAHLPLQNALSVCQSKDYVYASCGNGVIGVNVENKLIEKYTKVSGLAEVFVAQVGYDTATSTLVIAYTNSNIDLIRNGKIMNLPYLKNANIIGDKDIYHIFCANGIAYLATGFGIMKVNLEKQEISETAIFNDGVMTYKANAVWANQDTIFAATSKGIVSGVISSTINLLDFNNWKQYNIGIPPTNASAITQYQGKIITALGNVLYQWDGMNWSTFFTEANWVTRHLNNSNGHLLIAQQKLDGSGNVIDNRIGKWNGVSFNFYANSGTIAYPLQILEDRTNNIWFADLYRGLSYQEGGNFYAIYPNAPPAISCKEMAFLDGTLWVASSNITDGWSPAFNKNGIYFCKDYHWDNLSIYNTPLLDSFFDIAVVRPIPPEQKIIFGSQMGILEYSVPDKNFKINKFRPGAVDPSKKIFRITGADIDNQGNVWMSDTYSNTPIVCRKADGNYTYFNAGFLNDKLVKAIVVDDYNQIWVAKADGLTMLYYGNDIDNKSDDAYFNFTTGSGNGNLPSNNVICLVKDKDGYIWLGTDHGIARIACAGYVTQNACEAEQICIDRKDGSGFCDNLLEDETINCILVDNANRKWIGTNNGLFLISADGLNTIHYFNENNAPLLSNNIRSLAINPDNGDLFIGTGKGICSYRAEATVTNAETADPFVYPNPVRNDYDGLIAFKGIPNNCNVKIVDVSGNLVYETTATGGQATWDGNLTNGMRAATGVYFALCKGSGKKETAKLKFVFMH